MFVIANYSDDGSYADREIALMPDEDWVNSLSIDNKVWDVTDATGPFVTMGEIRSSTWMNESIILMGFEKAGYKWDEFSLLVGRHGIAQFGIWMSFAARQCYLANDWMLRKPYEKDNDAAKLLAAEIAERLGLLASAGVSKTRIDDLLLFSIALSGTLGTESVRWDLIDDIESHFGIGNALLLRTHGYSHEQLIEAIDKDIDIPLLLSVDNRS